MNELLFLFESRVDGVREQLQMTWDEADRFAADNRLRIVKATGRSSAPREDRYAGQSTWDPNA